MYIHIYAHKYICIYAHTCVYIYIYLHTRICASTYIYRNKSANTCKRTTRTWKQAEKFAKCPKQKCTCTKHNTMLDTYFWKSPKKITCYNYTYITIWKQIFFLSDKSCTCVCNMLAYSYDFATSTITSQPTKRQHVLLSLSPTIHRSLHIHTNAGTHVWSHAHTHTCHTHAHTGRSKNRIPHTSFNKNYHTHTSDHTHTHT
jgi:hypothetical protein